MFPRTETIRSHKSRAGIQSNLNPASKEMISDSVDLCETEVCFLTHPTYWNQCLTSKNAQCSSRSGFRNLKISRKIGVLKQSQPALFCSITHIAIPFVFMCDEFKISIDSGVCHRRWSILKSISQVHPPTTEHQVFRCVPSISIY